MASNRTYLSPKDPSIPPYGAPGYFDLRVILVPPPPGVTPNFNAPNPNGSVYIALSVILLLIASAFTGMRMYTKLVVTRSLGWDDYTCALSLIGVFLWTGATIKMAVLGMGGHSWNDGTTLGEHQSFLLMTFIAEIAYFYIICIVKCSILLSYLRMFVLTRSFRNTIYVILFFIIAVHIVNYLTFLVTLIPTSCNFNIRVSVKDFYAHCTLHIPTRKIQAWYIFVCIFTIVLDVVILTIPVRPVWKLNMAKRHKMIIVGIFVSGIIVTTASCLRLVYLWDRFYIDKYHDHWGTEFRVNIISTVEVNIAVICICLPSLKAFMKRHMPSVMRYASSKKTSGRYRSSNKRSKANHSSVHHPIKMDKKWATESGDQQLTRAAYVELGEDGKSDQNYAMNGIEVKTDIDVNSNKRDVDLPKGIV